MTTQVIYNEYGFPIETGETVDQLQKPEPLGSFYQTLLDKTGDDWADIEQRQIQLGHG